MALASEQARKFMDGNSQRKVVVIRGKLVNIVVETDVQPGRIGHRHNARPCQAVHVTNESTNCRTRQPRVLCQLLLTSTDQIILCKR